MTTKANEDVRGLIRANNLYQWQVADVLEVSDVTFMKWLRHPLPDDKRKRVINAILILTASRVEETGTGGQDQG